MIEKLYEEEDEALEFQSQEGFRVNVKSNALLFVELHLESKGNDFFEPRVV